MGQGAGQERVIPVAAVRFFQQGQQPPAAAGVEVPRRAVDLGAEPG